MRIDLPIVDLELSCKFKIFDFESKNSIFSKFKNAAVLVLGILLFNISFVQNTSAQAQPAGFVANPVMSAGQVFLACGPIAPANANVVYRLFYSLTASAPMNPLTAPQYTFGSTPGDGNGTNAFGFNLTGLMAGQGYTFWLYQFNTATATYSTPAIATQNAGVAGPPATPAGFVANPSGGSGQVFLACGPNNVGSNNIVYRLFYSPTATAPANPLTAPQYTFGSTAGDGNGTAAFGFDLTGLVPGTGYTFWLYQYNTSTMQYSATPATATQTSSGATSAPTSPYCATSVTHFAGDPGSAILLTIKNTGANSMEVRIESANSDPVDDLILAGSPAPGGAISAISNPSPGVFVRTITWAGTPPSNVIFDAILWSKVSFGGNWQLSMTPTTIPFTASCPAAPTPTSPTTNLPNPTCAAANVINIYGGAYPTTIATNYNPNWGQSGFCCVNPAFNPGTGNLVLAYPNFNYQGTELVSTNASGMTYLNFDIWTPANPLTTTIQVSPINFGTGPAEVLVTIPYTSGDWTRVSLPKSAFTGMTWNDVRQLKFAANGPGSLVPVDIYLDNVYFSTCAPPPPPTPTTNLPNPTCAAANVINIYGGAYPTNIATNYNPNWGQSGFCCVNPNFNPGTGNVLLAYPNFNYQGTELTPTNASAMTFLNFDIWTNASPITTTIQVSPINFGTGAAEVLVTVPYTSGGWTRVSLPKSLFAGMTWNDVRQLKFAANGPGSLVPVDIYLDNIYFSTCAPTAPNTSPTNPTCPPANVISVYGESYPNIATNYNPNWGQSGFCCVNPTFNPGTGNLALAYTNFNYQGTELIPTNASTMEYLHFDIWTNANPLNTILQVSPINFGTGTMEFLVTVPYTSGAWTKVVLPKSAFTGMTWNDIRQLKFAANGPGSTVPVDIYLDNIYFSNCLPTAPVTAAPLPTCAQANVISMFSNTYTNVPVDTWRTPWSSAILTDIQIFGNDTKLYTNLDFVGIETVGPNLLNLTNMTFMHLDIWTPNMTTVRVKLVDFGPNRTFGGGDDSEHEVVLNCTTQSGWNSFHIPLSGFTNLRSRAQIAQLIISGIPVGAGTLYVDNVYFTTCAPTGGIKVAATISINETSGLINNDGVICAGATATLTASGGGTYLWNTGATTVSITTGVAGTYTVTVTNPTGCSFPVSRVITVTPNPTPVITVTDISGTTNNDGIICQGATATLTASGGTSYLWSNGATTAGITTGVAGTYTVTVTSNGCSASTSRTITVNPNPTASISLAETSGPVDNDGMIYEGAVVYLTASGGGTYAWSTGATTANIIVTPMVTTTYTVTVTNANGCTATASRIITVEPNVCLLVCSGNQNITLPGGVCEYQVPNLVTKTGICEDLDIIPPPLVGFTGAFAYANRYFHSVPQGSDPAYGNLPCTNITGMPNQLVLQSADVLSGGNTCNYFGTVVTWTVPANGTISFNWATQTNDPTWDNFGYSLTNDPNTPTGLFLGTLQTTTTVLADVTASGMVTIPVTAGQRFSLVTYTEDGFGGPLTATINNFRFQEAQVTLPWTIVQTAGPTPGSFVGAGTYQLCYELLDPRGRVTDQCCFTITVGNFPTPTRSLVCNNHINISADQNCQVFLNADMFLEGGPYGCYNSYQINIWPFNSQANAINNIPHNVGLNLPTGNHTYEIVDPVTGNKCWGTFTVEDKIAPVVTCNCQDIDIPTPVTQFAGSLTATDPVFDRCGFTGFGTWPYDVYQFQVSTTGSYTFTANSPAGDTYAYINANTFDPANPCLGNIAQNDDGAGGLDPLITINLTAGVTYYYIFTNWSPFDAPSGPYTVNITGPGQIVTIVNPSEDPACQFACYDIEVVKRETVGMLYNIPGQNANRSKLTTPPVAIDACGPVSRTFEDRITSTNCGASKLIRDWKFTDAMGNTTFCSQTFTFNQITVFDLTVPTRDVNLTCGLDASPSAIAGYTDVDSRPQPASTTNIGIYADDWAQTPTVVELHEGNVNGYFTYPQIGFDGNFHPQKVDNGVCNIYTSYTDQMINACGIGCGGNMKVIRTWTILDWCTGDVFTYIQVIKATDEKAPTFFVKDHTISVDPWGCLANWTVDQPWELQDNCAKSEELKWGVKVPAGVTLSGTQPNYTLTGMPKGRHAITYWASDCCGNVSEVVAFVTVIDASAPVAVAKQNIVMSLTGSGTGADGAGKIYGWQIDNGSYDHCTPVKFEVRRLSGGACGNLGANGTHNNNSTYNDNNGFTSEVPGRVWFHPNDNAQDTDGGEFVKFCCEDIPAGSDHGLHEVEMRVWDDGNMNGIYGDNEIIDGMKDNYNTTWVTIRVENKLPPTLVCPPDVTVTCDMELNLSLDADTPVSAVNLTMTGYPKAFDLCSNLDITYRDAWIGANDPICKKGTIRRTFKVTKGSVVVTCPQFITVTTITAPFTVTFPQNNGTTAWDKCTFSLEDARDASNPTIKKPIVNYGQCDIVGENIKIDTFLFEDGACKKWRVEYTYINWCAPAGQNTLGGFVHYYTYKDEIAPVLTCTNQMFAANPNPANPNGGCEASVILEASATDALVCADESWVKWQGFFDGWADGTVDRLASSFVNKSWNGIWVPQARLIAGQPNPTWIALQNQHPNAPLADLVFVTYVAPSKASGGTVKLPAFILDAENISHKVLWKVTDGCGNVDQCESTVMVVDKKAPTPYCVSISTALMQGTPGMVELWAKDFDKGAFDNCSPQSKLYFTFDGVAPIYARVNEEHFYKAGANGSVNATATEYAQGRAYKWLPSMRSAGKVWTAAGTFNVNVDVWDEAWNTDYCTVVLTIRGPQGSRISGHIATEDNQGVFNTQVIATASLPDYPKVDMTNASGDYAMDIVVDTELKALKDGDDINGVSTIDLVMIQRHILGLQALNSPYKLIAADANNDGKVTASDLTEIRKLILGVTNEFSNNNSWRFPVKDQTMDAQSPFPYTENMMASVSDPNPSYDFVAVKIGDVNGSVVTNINNPSVEGRSNSNVVMTVADAVVAAGEVVEIPVTAANFSDVAGFQYTMNLEGASFVGINSGAIEMTANNVGVLANGVVTMSYASNEAVSVNEGEVLFTLVVRTDKATTVSEVLSMSSDVTKAESYNSDLKVGNVSLNVRTAPVASIELFQNEPNPWKGQTTVSFHMPVAATATLSVYDVTGKVVTVRNIDAAKGLNSEVFTKEQLGVSGVLYYTLVSGEFTATKKMIIVE
jgi:hypothetical protein